MTTIGASIQVLYAGRLEYLAANGFEITVVCAPSELDQAIRDRGVRLRTFAFTRAITLWNDIWVLVQLCRFLRTERFDLVEVSTPKAGLIGSLAAWGAGSRGLIHVLHGASYEGKRGVLGALLRAATSVPCRLADVTFAVSPSVAGRVCADCLVPSDRIRVLGAGSANGVDIARFSPDKTASGRLIRTSYRIPLEAVVIGFVGRLTRDKGLDELAQSFEALYDEMPDTMLLVVGDYDSRDCPSIEATRILSRHPGVRHVGWCPDVIPFMAAMDIVVLPTHREGLGNVLLEAAALGLPTVTTNATGARDAMVDGKTGLRVSVGDSADLKRALLTLIRDPSLRTAMGRAGRAWVSEHFEQRAVWRRYVGEYRELLGTIPCQE